MWQQALNYRILQYNTPLTIGHLFRSSTLIVNAALDTNAAFPFGKRTYKLAAVLFPIFYTSETGFIKGHPKRLYLGKHQIEFSNPFSYAYNLEISIHPWTSQLDLTIWESDENINIDTKIQSERIQNSLDRIESKIDASRTYGS